jgi:hypothetical protein
MQKTPYTGDKLKIDGYYYSNPIYRNDIRVAIFYKDGFCIFTWATPNSQDTLNYIENEILLNDKYISELKSNPDHIGVFQIIDSDIEIEAWEYRSWIFTHFGKIVNDTTFIINKRKDNNSQKSYSEDITFRFKQFSPKPDSTNVWIK